TSVLAKCDEGRCRDRIMCKEEMEYPLLARARETLAEAELLAGSGFRFGAINRLYYACFYAVTALLQMEGFSSHKHSGVISLFDQHWIKPGRLPIAMGRFYRKLFELRHHGDYASMVPLEEAQLSDLLEEARRFIEQVERAIHRGPPDVSQEASP
ncbi:MAG: HEPN domain-containing protein, partial [Armatimonadota bacterium]|nr:HEPN domain-containing protein [bacterium]MDW8322120.1 HEPN domain-containing protein [Armatimonadota bacterium]